MKLRSLSGLEQSGKKSVSDSCSTKHRSGGGRGMRPVLVKPDGDNRRNAPVGSGSENYSSMADDGHHAKRRGVVKPKRGKMEGVAPQGKPQRKKTRGRVKIKMEFIKSKARRYTTFSKRKIGMMKKAYELAMLTGTQVLLLVVSETGHVYTNATHKFQPMIISEEGKALIQTCLNSPDPPSHYDPSTDMRVSNKGFEEADLTFQVSESESLERTEDARLRGTTSSAQSTGPTAFSTTGQMGSGLSFSNYLPTVSTYGNFAEQLPSGFTIMPAGTPYPPGTPTISSLSQLQQHSVAPQQQHGQALASSVPMSHGHMGHMMYSNPHTMLYPSTHNRQYVYSQGPSAMQVSYAQTQ